MPRTASLIPRLDSTLNKKRATGLVALAILLSLYFLFGRSPTLDAARSELVAASGSARIECFQGECFDTKDTPKAPLLSRLWSFSSAFLKLVALEITLALVVVGLADSFLFPQKRAQGTRTQGAGSAQRRFLRSAICRNGTRLEVARPDEVGPATLNLSALIVAAMVFGPMLAGATIALSIVGILILAPLAAIAAGRRRRLIGGVRVVMAPNQQGPSPWRNAVLEGTRDWAEATLGHLFRFGPVLLVAAFASGLAVQWLNPDTVDTFLGDNMLGVAVAASLGIVIAVPLMLKIPLVAALLLIGMGIAPAATFLVAAAAVGPGSLRSLAKVMPKKAVAAFGTAALGLGVAGGLVVLGLGLQIYGAEFGSRAQASNAPLDASSPKVYAAYNEGGSRMYKLPPEVALRIYGEAILRVEDYPAKVAGSYAGTMLSDGGDIDREMTLTLKQTGFDVNGDIQVVGATSWGGPFSGTADSANFEFSLDVASPGPAGTVTFIGDLQEGESGYKMTGALIGTYHVISTDERGTWEATIVKAE